MTGQFFISLLNPGIGLILAAAFLLLWLNQREQTYVAVAAASYSAMALGFLIQDVLPPHPLELHRIASNFFFLLAGSMLAIAVLGRYRLKVPYAALGAFVAAGMAGLCWFLIAEPSITHRIYSVSFALGAISLIMSARLRRLEKPRLIDRLLFWITVLTGINFILRPAAIFFLVGTIETYDGFQQSLYWSTVQFSQAMISIVFALILLVAVATDLIGELRQQAHTDKLSGLLNRRGFEEKASEVLAECAARRRPVSLLIADLDHFKAVNDTWGHAIGDRAIALFGAMLGRTAGPDMIVGRIGGEEFAVLMPDMELNLARLFAERLRAATALMGAGALPAGLEPTVSAGLAAAHGETRLYDLLSNADLALYEAKRTGRNRVCVFRAGPDSAAEEAVRH